MTKLQSTLAAITLTSMLSDMAMPIPLGEYPMKQVNPRLAVKKAKKARRINRMKRR